MSRFAHDFEPIAPVGSAWRAAEDYGLDMSLVDDALRRSPWERIQQHQAALETLDMLRRAYVEQYARPPRNS